MGLHTILIADDDVSLLEALKVRLEAEQFTVIAVQDAYQALEQARLHEPDLLVLDINMPAGNGLSVQHRIDRIEELAGTPVIYVTGANPDSVNWKAAASDSYAVLHKPFDTDRLMDASRVALGYWTEPSDVHLAHV